MMHGILKQKLQVIHATAAKPEHLAALEAAGGSLSLTPVSEDRVVFAITEINHFASVPRTRPWNRGFRPLWCG
jgi:cytosine/adenosine deaminase-related metal-dependent hydrolase